MRRLPVVVVLLALVVLVGVARAEDKANPTGAWKFSVSFNNQTFERTVKLKLDGDKLTGSMSGREGQPDTAIEDGKYKDGQVSFKVVRERNGQKFATKYEGKVSGDTIKGKMESDFGGQTRSSDWEAKRVKE